MGNKEMNIAVIDKFTPLNYIDDVFEPKYSEKVVYIASWKITRSKYDIHLVFPRVNDTSEFAGDWFISRKKAMSYKKLYDNNGMKCRVIPWSEFSKLTRSERSEKELW